MAGRGRRRARRARRRPGADRPGQADAPDVAGSRARQPAEIDAWLAAAARGDQREATMFDLSGRTALVTGASGGIGGAIAAPAARPGRARRADRAPARGAGRSWPREFGERTAVEPADLADAAAADAAGRRRPRPRAALDILVNNAGLTRDGLALRLKDEDWQTVLDVNLTAGFRLIRSALRGMMQAPLRADRQHHLGRRRDRQPGPGQLRRRQGRPDRHEQGAGRRGRRRAASPSTASRRASSRPR